MPLSGKAHQDAGRGGFVGNNRHAQQGNQAPLGGKVALRARGGRGQIQNGLAGAARQGLPADASGKIQGLGEKAPVFRVANRGQPEPVHGRGCFPAPQAADRQGQKPGGRPGNRRQQGLRVVPGHDFPVQVVEGLENPAEGIGGFGVRHGKTYSPVR